MTFKFGFGYIYYMLCAISVLAVSGTEMLTKYVCSGNSVQAFQNIRFNKCSSVVSLYIHGEGNPLIARWSYENCSQSETLLPDYNDRVFLYSNGTISIHNVHPWDEATYNVTYQIGNISMEDVVQIIVMVAPTSDCISKILHQGSSLFASLKAQNCGKPVANLYWKGYSDVPRKSGPLLKLNPRNQDGTYYACIEGPALKCAKNALDYCSNFTIGVSGAAIITKYVCSGDSVQAFQNITFNKCNSVVSLSIHSEKRNTLIASWSFENCSQNETILPDYNDRVFLYGNGTISIHNAHPWDEANYIVNYQKGNESMEDVVHIIVMAAPANDCIPKILHQGSSLYASLKANSCGKPVATLYWKGSEFCLKTHEPVLNLNPRKQDGTYYACIEGPAVACARNALDYCSNVTIGEKRPPILLKTCDVEMDTVSVVAIVSGILLTLVTFVILNRKSCRQRTTRFLKRALEYRRANEKSTKKKEVIYMSSVPGSSKAAIRSENHPDDNDDSNIMPLLETKTHGPPYDDTLRRQHIVVLEKHHEPLTKHVVANIHQVVTPSLDELSVTLTQHSGTGIETAPKQSVSTEEMFNASNSDNLNGDQIVISGKFRELWNKHFDSLDWEDIKQLLNDKQQQGLNNDCGQ